MAEEERDDQETVDPKLSNEELGARVRGIVHSGRNASSQLQALQHLKPLCDPPELEQEPEEEEPEEEMPDDDPTPANDGGNAPPIE
jgi:hypothetical protein